HSPMSWVTPMRSWLDMSRASHAAGLTTRSLSKSVSPTGPLLDLHAYKPAGATVLQHASKARDADEGRLRSGAGTPPGAPQAQRHRGEQAGGVVAHHQPAGVPGTRRLGDLRVGLSQLSPVSGKHQGGLAKHEEPHREPDVPQRPTSSRWRNVVRA